MKRLIPLAIVALALTACGVRQDNTWIDTTDPLTGTRLSCFYVDGHNAGALHCIEVAP